MSVTMDTHRLQYNEQYKKAIEQLFGEWKKQSYRLGEAERERGEIVGKKKLNATEIKASLCVKRT